MVVSLRPSKDSEDARLWDRYVLDHPIGTGYHLTAWATVVERVFGHQTLYLMERDVDGRVRGVLPLVLLSSRLFGRFLVSLPYVNYGGVLADDQETQDVLLNAAIEKATALGAEHMELRHCGGFPLGWPAKDHKVSMRLALPSNHEDLLKSFPPKLRSQLRRGEKEGMTVQIGGVELVDQFYTVFSLNMRDLGTPVYGKRFFSEIAETFPKDSKIFIVRYQGSPVASGLVYGFRQMLEVPWAASDRRYARFAPNMLLYGAMLKYACEQGYRWFDFGRSSKGSGTYRFKEQWGARPVQLQWYYWLRNGRTLPELNPQNPKYRMAIGLWKRCPVFLTTRIGPYLSKYLP